MDGGILTHPRAVLANDRPFSGIRLFGIHGGVTVVRSAQLGLPA